MRFQVRSELARLHPVDPRRALVAFYRFQRPLVIPRLDGLFHQLLVHRSLSKGPRKFRLLTAAIPAYDGFIVPAWALLVATVFAVLGFQVFSRLGFQFLF